MPATVREQNHNRKLMSLKKKMAQMSSNRNKQQREALLQQANALLADMADAPVKKNKKKINEEEHEGPMLVLRTKIGCKRWWLRSKEHGGRSFPRTGQI